MIIIPAIDLKEGKCVRLRQGKMDSSTVFNEDPAAQARLWVDSGASRIHVVDLDGSVGGTPVNLRQIERIVNAVRVPVQLGGGIRNVETIRMYLDTGINTVILGTLAAKEPDRVLGFMRQFPGHVAVGIDAKSGLVAIHGWTESADITAIQLASHLSEGSPAAFIYTDIDRDGMMRGPNIGATREFAISTNTPVILSGGVSTISDVEMILPLEKDGVMGIIIGRALYEGKIDLKEAVRLAEG
ncbi:MAG: 1-(5-phosphoribosyl)-5-[(5-phosphoribosylamino)methylideneamino]imidazole-4-carboxamide isomerase [Desulfomonile tiedjei]|uniref:1-(5-phosphoribosyl)-5-[(5-phosphoribosylamino)methylideneamino] imidazole-4-carboxamide isomerase n=1 Tax=Desulfomonile tiedjei TaxID=2358 RepID=A0A9D6UZ17_9BACT|nr:1-(5-phosphoribosyl)-5-[(5-phosphoribosylamino)methylideneamino]imidazole-4-carboxamide isomerase [Desulfomonile tiedjei]